MENQSLISKNSQEVFCDTEKRNAAYALNLCTVSISQIVDYNDLFILEQEYDNILNNLNLHNMPKDEALLDILKHILDTITYFRIAEGDKKMLDKKYQHKMKNAIWSSVPNLVSIVTTGSPIAIAISLAAQVGIGYMNYRKEKAKIDIEKEEEEWKLERTAIDQFNGLRRDLFDTAWRLADRYNFEDELRLTERQISQYNQILMEPNALRRLERLEVIKNNFTAYPPFWYYIGSAANEVAVEIAQKNGNKPTNSFSDSDKYSYYKYREKAEQYFKQLVDREETDCRNNAATQYATDRLDLLREDQIRASCCLEYIEILMEKVELDTNKISRLIEDAIRHSGRKYDVLQFCAIDYLKIKDYDRAETILRELAINNYNQKTNTILLCASYLNDLVCERKSYNEVKDLHDTLGKLVPKNYLISFPNSSDRKEIDRVNDEFRIMEKLNLIDQTNYVIDKLVEHYAILQNRELQCPEFDNSEYTDTFFRDTEDAKLLRESEFGRLKRGKMTDYCNMLRDKMIRVVIERYVNLLYQDLNSITALSEFSNRDLSQYEKLKSTLTDSISNKSATIRDIYNLLEDDRFCIDDVNRFNEVSITNLFAAYITKLKDYITNLIWELDNVSQIANVESSLIEKCRELKCELPEYFENETIDNDNTQEAPEIKVGELLGCEGSEELLSQKVLEILQRYDSCGLMYKDDNSPRLILQQTEDFYEKGKKTITKVREKLQIGPVLALLKGESNKSILFTGSCIVSFDDSWVLADKTLTLPYNEINYNEEKGQLEDKNGSMLFKHEKIKMSKLANCIKECASQQPKTSKEVQAISIFTGSAITDIVLTAVTSQLSTIYGRKQNRLLPNAK